jgi:hypothetical protein
MGNDRVEEDAVLADEVLEPGYALAEEEEDVGRGYKEPTAKVAAGAAEALAVIQALLGNVTFP